MDVLAADIRAEAHDVALVRDDEDELVLAEEPAQRGVLLALPLARLDRDGQVPVALEPPAQDRVSDERRSPVDEEEIQGAELREVQRAILEAHGVVGLGPVLGVADVVHEHAIAVDVGKGQRRHVGLPVRARWTAGWRATPRGPRRTPPGSRRPPTGAGARARQRPPHPPGGERRARRGATAARAARSRSRWPAPSIRAGRCTRAPPGRARPTPPGESIGQLPFQNGEPAEGSHGGPPAAGRWIGSDSSGLTARARPCSTRRSRRRPAGTRCCRSGSTSCRSC